MIKPAIQNQNRAKQRTCEFTASTVKSPVPDWQSQANERQRRGFQPSV